MKAVLLLAAATVLGGCATPGETDSRALYEGQWTKAQVIGPGRHMIQGYSTQDAIKGATQFCARSGKQLSTDSVQTATQDSSATVMFRCY